MDYFNTGVIQSDKPLDNHAKEIIQEIFGATDEWLWITDNSIEFQEYSSGTFESKMDRLVDRLGELGIQLEGRVDYDGSYEGAHIWKKGEHHIELEHDQVAILDAGTKTLIAELEQRGYRVQPPQEQTHGGTPARGEATIAADVVDDYRAFLRIPHTPAEGAWLEERFSTLSAKESIALAAATMDGPPETIVEAVNLIKSLKDYVVCFGASCYDDLGAHYLEQKRFPIPEMAQEFVNFYALGTMFEDKHPGLFVGSDYVMYPEGELETPYDGYHPNTLQDEDWSVKVKLASPAKPEGVWLRLPDYSEPQSVAGPDEVTAALRALGVEALGKCTIADARCILPEAGNLLEQYDSAEELIEDGNRLGVLIDGSGGGLPRLRATMAAVLEREGCAALPELLDALERHEFVTNDERREFAREELRKCGMPDDLIDRGVVDLDGFAAELLQQQGFQPDRTGNVYIKPRYESPQMEQAQPTAPVLGM